MPLDIHRRSSSPSSPQPAPSQQIPLHYSSTTSVPEASHPPDSAPPSYSHGNEHDRRLSSDSTSTDLELNSMNHQTHHPSDEEALLPSPVKGKSKGSDHPSPNSQDEDGEYEEETWSWGQGLFYQDALINLILIGLWYLFSVSISVYNKWMFADGQLNFHFPLFTTAMHMIVQFILSSLVLIIFPQLRPRSDALDKQPSQNKDPSKPLITSWFYFTRITPCAAATGLDIGLGNTSLRWVTLVFFTMCKSSTLGFVLLFAIVFRLEKASWKLAMIIGIMTVGVIMMVYGETAFNVVGFVLLMLASLFSGLRWSLTQMLLRRHPATSNPFASLFFLTPMMFLTLFALAVPVEGFWPVKEGFDELAQKKGLSLSISILLFPGALAFLMTSAEFALLKRTSVVTLSVCGIFKEVITIVAGTMIFDDKLTSVNVSGLMVTIIAIGAYNYIRVKKMKRKAMMQAQEGNEEQEPMLSTHAGANQEMRRGHRPRMSTGDMIRRSLSMSTQATQRIGARENNTRSPLVKLPEDVK